MNLMTYFPIIIWSDYSGDSRQLYSVADHYSFPDLFQLNHEITGYCRTDERMDRKTLLQSRFVAIKNQICGFGTQLRAYTWQKSLLVSQKNLEKNNGPRRNIVADYHRCNLIILLLENKSHKIPFTNRRFWLVRLVGRKMVVGILDSFYVVFVPLLAPIPNFIQIGQKHRS